MTVEEACALMTPAAYEHLHEVVCEYEIDTSKKKDCDIVMSALCKSVENNVIKKTSLDDKIVQILNSDTATLTAEKLSGILNTIRSRQNIVCLIYLKYKDKKVVFDMDPTIKSYNRIFDWVIRNCNVTSVGIRELLKDRYKATTINNVAQILQKHSANPLDEVSIKNITRIFNAYGGVITCKIDHEDVAYEDAREYVLYF